MTMKRILIFAAALMLIIPPLAAQEKQEKLRTLEELEKKEPAKPDTVVTAAAEAAEAAATVEAVEAIGEADVEVEADTEADYYDDTTTVSVGDVVTVQETGDETIVRIGKKGVKIIDEDGNTEISFGDYDDDWHNHRSDRFRGHLGGIELGFTGYMSDFWTTSLPSEDSYMNLNTTKSTVFNIVLPNVNIPFSSHFGIAAALGFNFADYVFDGNNTIAEDENGVIGPVPAPDGVTFKKSKLATTYLIMPVIFEGQIPLSHSRTVNIGAGFIGGLKLGSHTKVIYYDNDKVKAKAKDDFNLNLLRYGLTARLGYEMVQVYGTTYLSNFFEEGKGPQLYPFEVGIALTFNN